MSQMIQTKPSVSREPLRTLPGWTTALAAAGLVSLGAIAQAEEAQSHVMTALSQTTLSGYVDTSAIWRPGTTTRGGALPGRTFDGADRQDGFNLHAVKLTLERPLDESQFSAGYKADLVFGPDANYYSTLLNGGGGPNADDFSIKQAYVALRAPIGNGIDIKLGVWDTLIGYEVFESGNNPNFSRSYGYFIEPTQHTGVLASYHVNDMISLSAGVANTYTGAVNDRVGTESQKTYLGTVTITLPEGAAFLAGSTIYLGVVDGVNGMTGPGPNGQDTTSWYAGASLSTPVTGLTLGLAYDYRDDGLNALSVPGAENDNWAWAGALYASYQASEKLKLNLRADYTKASNGTYFVTAPGGEDENELGSLTATIDYSLWANVITRAEVRFDHSFNDENPFNGDEENALTVAANVIYKF
jgi:hypothetical protein